MIQRGWFGEASLLPGWIPVGCWVGGGSDLRAFGGRWMLGPSQVSSCPPSVRIVHLAKPTVPQEGG